MRMVPSRSVSTRNAQQWDCGICGPSLTKRACGVGFLPSQRISHQAFASTTAVHTLYDAMIQCCGSLMEWLCEAPSSRAVEVMLAHGEKKTMRPPER